MLKDTAEAITQVLSLQLVLKTGKVPEAWKASSVVAIPLRQKSGGGTTNKSRVPCPSAGTYVVLLVL